MNVSVTIQLSVPAAVKHWRQMQQIAASLTDSKESIQVSQPAGEPKELTVRFTVPQARQADIVNHIGRQFWNVENYSDSTIGFSSEPRRTRRSRPQSPPRA